MQYFPPTIPPQPQQHQQDQQQQQDHFKECGAISHLLYFYFTPIKTVEIVTDEKK